MPRRKVTKTQVHDMGDGRHQVATITSESNGAPLAHRKIPCEQCPWRKDSPIGAFPANAYRHSANTAYDLSMHQFSCHMSGWEKPTTCAGFLNSGADNNLSVRLAIAEGRFRYEDMPVSPYPLYESYREMAEANGVPADDPALDGCRSNRR